MLKITNVSRPSAPRLVKLEGTLLAPWVAEVRAVCLALTATDAPRLDLAGVTFVDQSGAQLLHELVHGGIRIETCSPFVAELLHWKAHP